ncbi:hypothetical protein, partial [Acidipropionibacterium jensenii]
MAASPHNTRNNTALEDSATPTTTVNGPEENYPSHHLGYLVNAAHDIRVPVTMINQDDSPDGSPNAPL